MITGENIGRDVNTSRLNIWGGSNMTSGGRIILYGSDYTTSSDKGRITLQAFDGSENSLLTLYPSGTFTFNNNGSIKNLAMQEDFIPRSGGAVMTAKSLGKTDNTSRITFCGGTDNTKGGSITIYGKDSSSTGDITLQCTADSTNYYSLRLHSNGTLEHDYLNINRTNNSSSLRICGGKNNSSGGAIQLNGKDTVGNKGYAFISASDGTRTNEIQIRPNGDTLLADCLVFFPNIDNNTILGYGSFRWKAIYAATGTINTSDSRLKNSVKDIDDNLLDAWETIQPKQYKFNDATETKGEQARFHTGYLAQDIQKACTDNNIDATRYGLFCYDSWEEEPEITEDVEVEKDGVKTTEKRIVQSKKEKGDIYALRYEEALVVECAYLRREISRLKEELKQLKTK